jgi:hypothetical protein
MGYTSKFYKVKEISPSQWELFLVDFNKVLPHFEDLLDKTTDQKLVSMESVMNPMKHFT